MLLRSYIYASPQYKCLCTNNVVVVAKYSAVIQRWDKSATHSYIVSRNTEQYLFPHTVTLLQDGGLRAFSLLLSTRIHCAICLIRCASSIGTYRMHREQFMCSSILWSRCCIACLLDWWRSHHKWPCMFCLMLWTKLEPLVCCLVRK